MKLKEDEKKITFDEYLQGEEVAEFKHEFVDGEIYAMTGASYEHNLLTSTLNSLLFNHLRKGNCTTLSGDQMVTDRGNSFGYYPDIVAFCGKQKFFEKKKRSLTNPQVIIEVFSPSTEAHDHVRLSHLVKSSIPAIIKLLEF